MVRNMSDSVLLDKSIDFSIKIVNLSKYLQSDKKEFVLSKQICKSGTSIGANIHEAKYAQSTADFVSKLKIALKESYETEYWLKILVGTDYIDNDIFNSLINECGAIRRMLISSINTIQNK